MHGLWRDENSPLILKQGTNDPTPTNVINTSIAAITRSPYAPPPPPMGSPAPNHTSQTPQPVGGMTDTVPSSIDMRQQVHFTNGSKNF